jgi:hypothetical protein
MRRSSLRLGSEPCTSSTWCSEAWPGASTSGTASCGSTATSTSWPRVSRLCSLKVSRWAYWRRCVPGLHGARLDGARRQREPHGHHLRTAQAPVGRVLVPGDEARVMGFLDEEGGRPAQQVRTEHVLHRVHDARVVHKVPQPGEEQVALVTHRACERPAARALVGFEPRAQRQGLVALQHVQRRVPAGVAILRDRRGRQHPAVGCEGLAHHAASPGRWQSLFANRAPLAIPHAGRAARLRRS